MRLPFSLQDLEDELVRRLSGFISLIRGAEPVLRRDRVLEERLSTHGVEIVSHVNYSQIARVRRVRGLVSPLKCATQTWHRPRQLTITGTPAMETRRAA